MADTDYGTWQRAWRETLDVNLLGAANLSYCVARRLIDRGVEGAIVNVGSRGAFRGEPEAPAYGASKAGLHALGQSLAVSLAPHGISVTSVAPGFVETDRVADRLDGDSGARMAGSPPRRRSPPPSSTWPRRPPAGPPAPSSTSTAPPTFADVSGVKR